MVTFHSKILPSSIKPAENPSTGCLQRSTWTPKTNKQRLKQSYKNPETKNEKRKQGMVGFETFELFLEEETGLGGRRVHWGRRKRRRRRDGWFFGVWGIKEKKRVLCFIEREHPNWWDKTNYLGEFIKVYVTLYALCFKSTEGSICIRNTTKIKYIGVVILVFVFLYESSVHVGLEMDKFQRKNRRQKSFCS